MKVRTYFFGCLLSVLMWQCAPKENEYVVIAGKGVAEDTAWLKGGGGFLFWVLCKISVF